MEDPAIRKGFLEAEAAEAKAMAEAAAAKAKAEAEQQAAKAKAEADAVAQVSPIPGGGCGGGTQASPGLTRVFPRPGGGSGLGGRNGAGGGYEPPDCLLHLLGDDVGTEAESSSCAVEAEKAVHEEVPEEREVARPPQLSLFFSRCTVSFAMQSAESDLGSRASRRLLSRRSLRRRLRSEQHAACSHHRPCLYRTWRSLGVK
eukprot:443979-Rhodomonas_salina.2